MSKLLISEARLFPEWPPLLSEVRPGSLGLAIPMIEGECGWHDLDGTPWWTETHDGVRYKRTYRFS